MSQYSDIQYDVRDQIARLTLNRPEKLNSLSGNLCSEMVDAIRTADSDDNVRVIVIAGSDQSRAFSAGYDVSEEGGVPPLGKDPFAWRNQFAQDFNFELELWRARKPVIARIHGYCLGGGCELAMLADITIASDDAMFGEPEIRFLTAPPVLVMPWIVGIKRAKHLLMSGDMIPSQLALEWGMVNMVVPRSELDEEVSRWARKLAAFPTEAMVYTKAAINRGMEAGGLTATLNLGLELCTLIASSPTETGREFEERRSKDGLAAALKWVNSLYGDAPPRSDS